ncbi:MAG: hypothetical protein Q7U99_21260 [Rubrivivax sp.]|nr:hypothetical protein [Rubrivivax sp.]
MRIAITLDAVLVFTVVGGFLAVSLTDFVESRFMMLALVIMPATVPFCDGGGSWSQASRTLNEVDATLGLFGRAYAIRNGLDVQDPQTLASEATCPLRRVAAAPPCRPRRPGTAARSSRQ